MSEHTPIASFCELATDHATSARTGQLSLNGHMVSTPVLWLGHNFSGPVHYWEDKQTSIPGLLVNAYELTKMPKVSSAVQQKGIHRYLKYNGPIMMDSGGYLFQKEGQLEADATDIYDLYTQAGVDVGVALDHPLSPTAAHQENKLRWKRTLVNTAQLFSGENGHALMPVVHGYTLSDLELACAAIQDMTDNVPMVGIGSLVPLMKASHLGDGFRYTRRCGSQGDHIRFIADALQLVRAHFPNSLLHVFGVGGVTTILATFALGADSVDSVAWRLKAAYGAIQLPGTSDRFLSPRPESERTRKVLDDEELELLAQCGCPICGGYTRLGWQRKRLEASFEARATHNAWVFFQEIALFREAVEVGRTVDLLEDRMSRTHRLYSLLPLPN